MEVAIRKLELPKRTLRAARVPILAILELELPNACPANLKSSWNYAKCTFHTPGRRRPFLKWPSPLGHFKKNARPFVGLHQRPIKGHLTANSEMALGYGIALRFRCFSGSGLPFEGVIMARQPGALCVM